MHLDFVLVKKNPNKTGKAFGNGKSKGKPKGKSKGKGKGNGKSKNLNGTSKRGKMELKPATRR